MSDSQSCKENTPNPYEEMSTESLRQLLQEDASKPAGERRNDEDLFRVMDVLAKRRQAQGDSRSPEEALASFKKYYDTEDMAHETASGLKKHSHRIVAAAVVAAILIAGTVTAGALKFDLWEPIAQWAQETLHLGYSGQDVRISDPESTKVVLSSGLQEVLYHYGIGASLAPTWLPEGYTENKIIIKETPQQTQFVAVYSNDGNDDILVWITNYLDSYPSQIEQSNTALEVYESNGIRYYIIENTEWLYTAWINGHFECCISGNVSLAEMEQIIDSIEKG